MLKCIILIAIFCTGITSQCTSGCLKCGSDSSCTFCDFTSNYYLTGLSCSLSKSLNCTLIDLGGNCLACSAGRYLDPVTMNCIEAQNQDRVANCLLYSDKGVCSACASGFFLTQGLCTIVTTTISNCTMYASATTCQTCNPGSFISSNGQACVRLQEKNCASYSQIACASCSPGYQNFSYGYLKPLILGKDFNSGFTRSFISIIRSNTMNTFELPTCIFLRNCAVVYANMTCGACISGFYVNLTTNLCQPNPTTTMVPYCLTFSIFGTCTSCFPGYFLANNATCTPISPVLNCKIYDTTASFTSCLACESAYYLTIFGSCVARKYLLIQDCSLLSSKQDSCQSCIPDYSLTTDSLACLPSTMNCAVYQTSTRLSLSLVCNTCMNGFYLTETSFCLPGDIVDCATYSGINICAACKNGFILQNQVCIIIREIPGCTVYSTTSHNVCITCNPSSVLVKTSGNCVNRSSIPLCAVYNSLTTCSQCQNGATLTSPTLCTSIAVPSCATYNLATCVECAPPNVFDQITGNCRQILQTHYQNCVPTMISGNVIGQTEGCKVCQQNSIFFNYKNGAFCFEAARLAAFNGSVLDNNCSVFKYHSSSNKYICVQCKPNYFLSSGSCALTCPRTIYPAYMTTYQTIGIYKMNQDMTFNHCGSILSNGCYMAGLHTVQASSTVTYACVRCYDATANLISMGGGDALKLDTNALVTQITPVSYVPIVLCFTPLASNVLGILNANNMVTSCDYYYDLPSQSKNGCVKCAFGMSGIVLNYIGNCFSFSGSVCTRCRSLFYLESPTSCLPVTTVANCIVYDGTASSTSCTECSATFYLSAANTCTTRTYQSPLCLVFNLVLDGCATCDSTTSYIASNICTAGTVTNCNFYSQSAVNTCLGCTGSLSVAENQCVSTLVGSGTNGHCRNIQPSDSKRCWNCQYNALMFEVRNKCAAFTQIPNCQTYISLTLCGVCNDSFTLSADQMSCTATTASLNCLINTPADLNDDGIIASGDWISGNVFLYTCTLCAPNFLMISTPTLFTSGDQSKSFDVGSCVANPFEYVHTNCQGDNTSEGTTLIQTYVCGGLGGGCKAGKSPFNFEGLTLCVTNTYLTNIRGSSLVTNCKIYAYSSGLYVCSVCNFGFGLQSGACVSKCTGSGTFIALKHYNIDSNNPSKISIGGENVCFSPPTQAPPIDEKCIMIAPEFVISGSSVRYACVKCDTNYNPVIQTAHYNDILTAFDFNNLSSTQIGSPLTAFPGIAKCLTGTAGTDYHVRGTTSGSGWPPIANCKYMMGLTSTETAPVIGCLTCNLGYSGTVASSATDTDHHINDCTQNSDFSTQQTYTGFQNNDDISKKWGSVFSIFGTVACTDTNKIPVVYRAVDISSRTLVGLRTYTKPVAQISVAMTDDVQTGLDSICVAPNPSTALADIGVSTIPFTNCALMLVNVLGINSVTNSGSDFSFYNPFCLACMPGFVPTFSTTFPSVIQSCVAFSDPVCSTAGTNLNSCNCVLKISTVSTITSIDFQKCSDLNQNNFQNCFAATNATTCALCKPGLNVNSAGQCVDIGVTTCSSSTTYNNDYLAIVGTNGLYPRGPDNSILFFNNVYQGCQACTSASYSIITVSKANDVFLSNQVCATTDNLFSPSRNTAADPNCELYGFTLTNTVTCTKCVTNFILKTNTINSCVAKTGFPNCVSVNGANNLCSQCEPEHMLVNNLCVLISTLSSLCSVWDTVNSVGASSALCSRCNDGHLLSSDFKTCSAIPNTAAYRNCLTGIGTACTVCSPGYVVTAIAGNPGYCFSLSSVTAGSYDHDPNCTELLNDGTEFAFSNSKLTCNKCKENFILSNTITVGNWCYKFHDVNNPEPSNCIRYFETQPNLSSLVFSCTGCPVSTHYLTGGTCVLRTTISNCLTYAANINACSACSPGFFLENGNTACTINPLKNFLPNPSGFINQCSAINDCASGVWLHGLSMPISGLFSCHKCNTASNIPFIAIDGGSNYSGIRSLLEYNFNATGTAPLSNYIGGQAVFCASPIAANFNIPLNLFTFPANCGLGLTNIKAVALDASNAAQASSVNLAKISVMCVACKPGFTSSSALSSSSTTVPLMVSSCTQIQNCVGTAWFNLCSQCASGYAFMASQSGSIAYTACNIFTQDVNCMVIQQINSVYSCRICKAGYFINVVGSCELINAPLCNSIQFDIGFEGITIFAGLAWQKFAGCSVCTSSAYLPTIMITDINVCHQSNYLISNANNLPFPLFPRNCVSFLNRMESAGYILCGVCAPNWYLNIANSCISIMPSNCILPVNTTYCSQCGSTYLNVNGACTIPSIADCSLYLMTISPYQICLACIPRFYLSNNLCIPGTIQNCIAYSSPSTCTECGSGYGLVSFINSTTYCVAITLPSNCLTLDPVQFNQFSVSCLTCEAGAIPQPLPTVNQQSTCIQLATIQNCISYDISSKFSLSSYNCKACANGFYLSENKCLTRTRSAMFCQSADPVSDDCWTCNHGYDLNATMSCVSPPVGGKVGCAVYDGSLNCVSCVTGFYLSGTTCQLINANRLIANCLTYSSNLTCLACYPGYYFNLAGGCSMSSASNCLTASDVNNCSSCSPGFGLYTLNERTNCVKLDIPLCLSISSVYPYNCLTCVTNFYPSQTGCSQVVNPVNSCLFYSADGVCRTCITGFALATNLTCVSMTQINGYADPNCQSFNFYPNGICTGCAPGYFFNSSACAGCLAKNCFVCDPSNSTICLLCQPGSYQTPTRLCINPNETLNNPNLINLAFNQTSFGNSIGKITSRIWILVLVMFFMGRFVEF